MLIGLRSRARSGCSLHGSGPTFDDVLGVRACALGVVRNLRLNGTLGGVLGRALEGLSFRRGGGLKPDSERIWLGQVRFVQQGSRLRTSKDGSEHGLLTDGYQESCGLSC